MSADDERPRKLKVDMSPAAVKARLLEVSRLWHLWCKLKRARPLPPDGDARATKD